jgi:ABC-type antimicrobial peptide transport system permease subunit
MFGSADPIGHRIYCGLDSPKPMTIVGIVGDVRQDSPASSMQPAIYMPLEQHPFYANEVEVVARSNSDPRMFIPPMRRVMQREAPDVAIEFTTLTGMVHESLAALRFRAVLSVVFAALAAVLAMAGVYAVMLFQVNQRRAEIGVPMALGATPGSIMGLSYAEH